ncbi:CLUMA_CG017555, isoform A [Clunio marinus]|uniref:CLUMA_CG017555, isoform A n=1 Tax=Clunio marinus TaxID=568069 RepID=A0A1J1J0U7_9DIPT|nr:CLUMA_CG017555, isoform A [Clunio marinus]
MKKNNDAIVIEKRIGCYRAGVLFSIALICILIIIVCIPPLFSSWGAHQELNTYLLIFLIFVFVILGCAIVMFINYQHRQAFKQRMKSEYGIYTLQRARLRRGESGVNSNGTELQKFDVNLNEKQTQSLKS